jgi:hypothetical protein
LEYRQTLYQKANNLASVDDIGKETRQKLEEAHRKELFDEEEAEARPDEQDQVGLALSKAVLDTFRKAPAKKKKLVDEMSAFE